VGSESEVVRAAREAGLDFVILTDHRSADAPQDSGDPLGRNSRRARQDPRERKGYRCRRTLPEPQDAGQLASSGDAGDRRLGDLRPRRRRPCPAQGPLGRLPSPRLGGERTRWPDAREPASPPSQRLRPARCGCLRFSLPLESLHGIGRPRRPSEDTRCRSPSARLWAFLQERRESHRAGEHAAA
jgi:hypothetical protein